MYQIRSFGMFVCLTVIVSHNCLVIDSAQAGDAIVCPAYAWMDWGSYKSWYALHHPDKEECSISSPVNYNSSSATSQNCPNCTAVTVMKTSARSPKKVSSLASIENGNSINHLKLDEKLENMRTDKFYYNKYINEHYKVRMGNDKTKRDFYYFEANVTKDGHTKTDRIYVIARHIDLKWNPKNPPPAEQTALYPNPLIMDIGQEVTVDAKENGQTTGGAGRFTEVDNVTSVVELKGKNVVHLKVDQGDGTWRIFHINTFSDIDSLP